jgi:hypothetical protein
VAHCYGDQSNRDVADVTVSELTRNALALAVAAVIAGVTTGEGVSTTNPAEDPDRCTMAVPQVRATVEARVAYASDFCELAAQVLVGNVFHVPVLVTPGVHWHYADTRPSCRLRYGDTQNRMTIRNSIAACRWLLRLAPDWRIETSPIPK